MSLKSPSYIHVLYVLNIVLRVELFVIVRVELSFYIILCLRISSITLILHIRDPFFDLFLCVI
jgi:hypothetical protein